MTTLIIGFKIFEELEPIWCWGLILDVFEQFSVWSQTSEDRQNRIPLTQRPQWVSQWAWCSQWAPPRYSCCRYHHQSSEDHPDWAWEEIWTHIERINLLLLDQVQTFVCVRIREGASAHRVPFFFRKEFLVLSVLLFSSREVKPPLSRVTDSSPVVVCLPAEKTYENWWSGFKRCIKTQQFGPT